jgi:hypothetical protein
MEKHHVIISGTGRAGTTFLVQLLTVLELDTGYSDLTTNVFTNCQAGMEWDIHNPEVPYIVKSPWLCDYLEEVLLKGNIVIDHALIPIRDIYSVAESRRDVQRRTDPSFLEGSKIIPGGLWHTDKPEEQEAILEQRFYQLIYTLVKYDIETTFLYFPRFIHDPEYLYKKIRFILKDIDYETFLKAFGKVVRPELVHNFNPKQETVKES